jgi:hypothetical protein
MELAYFGGSAQLWEVSGAALVVGDVVIAMRSCFAAILFCNASFAGPQRRLWPSIDLCSIISRLPW